MAELNHFVYKIVNKLNGKCYIGVHSTINVRDGYMGSGTLITRAIKKYGAENFTKEILFSFNTRAEALAKEAELVCNSFVCQDSTYNLVLGGGLIKQPDYSENRPYKAIERFNPEGYFVFWSNTKPKRVRYANEVLNRVIDEIASDFNPFEKVTELYNYKHSNRHGKRLLKLLAGYYHVEYKVEQWQDPEPIIV